LREDTVVVGLALMRMRTLRIACDCRNS